MATKKHTKAQKKLAEEYVNDSKHTFINSEDLKTGLFSLFQDHREDLNEEALKIEKNEELTEEEKQKLLDKTQTEYKVIELFTVVLNNFLESMTDDTMGILRKALSQLNENDYSVKRKITLFLIFLNSKYKEVPKLAWKNIYTNSDIQGCKYSLVPVTSDNKVDDKLSVNELEILRTLILYNQKQYKLLISERKLYDKTKKIKKNDYDHVFIDFVKTLEGQNIAELIKYFEIN